MTIHVENGLIIQKNVAYTTASVGIRQIPN